jgi:hypothetical protein
MPLRLTGLLQRACAAVCKLPLGACDLDANSLLASSSLLRPANISELSRVSILFQTARIAYPVLSVPMSVCGAVLSTRCHVGDRDLGLASLPGSLGSRICQTDHQLVKRTYVAATGRLRFTAIVIPH